MRKYLYYPGCSLRSTGKAYDESLRAVLHHLGIELKELEDWNCCGATSYASIDEMQAFSLAARNLALGERQKAAIADGVLDLVVPCNACYMVLTKTQKYMKTYAHVQAIVERALKEAGLSYRGDIRVRHPLDVVVNDIQPNRITEMVTHSLKDVRVACYYGCQVVRPFSEFDDANNPMTMDTIVRWLGAQPVDWSLKTRCCGGSLTGTIPDAGLPLNRLILHEARKRKADMIITCCPLCQFNLECFQDRINRDYDETFRMPVMYFTQLMGMAFGLPEKPIGMERLFIKPPTIPAKGGAKAHV